MAEDPRQAALVERVNAIATEGAALAAADDAVAYGRSAIARWTGLNALSSTPRDAIGVVVDAVALARQGFHSLGPTFPVSLTFPDVSPDWPRLAEAIRALYITVWAYEAQFPERGVGDDLTTAAGGLAADAGAGLGGALKDALGPLLWPVGVALALVIGVVVFAKLGGVKAA
jgi:hypothetical protein